MELLKYSLEWALNKSNKIDGWLKKEEAELLYNLALQIPKDTSVVEIGSYRGKSTVILGSALKSNDKKCCMYSIDPHQKPEGNIGEQYDEWTKGAYKDSYAELIKNIEKCELSDITTIIKKTSEQAHKQYAINIGLLFIDGLHERNWVEKDFLMWSPMVIKGGFIVMHDSTTQDPNGPWPVAQKYIVKSGLYKYDFIKSITWGKKYETM